MSALDPFTSVPDRCYNNTALLQTEFNHASGVLITRGDETFVWTAGHVAEFVMKSDGTFHLLHPNYHRNALQYQFGRRFCRRLSRNQD